jgi:AcrR family transcriptional regulator
VTGVKKLSPRSERAQQTRLRILDAARELFVQHGYGATVLQDVATRAGVSVQTIYFVYGNKRTLLKEVLDTAIAGDVEPVATMDRPWFREAMAARTATAHLRAHVAGTVEVLERVAPLVKVAEAAAAADPQIAELWSFEGNPRLVVQTTAATSLMAKPGARKEVPVEHAAAVLYGVLSPELYLLYVQDCGWSADQYAAWAYETLHGQLCSGRPGAAPRSGAGEVRA